jgi:two-component system OmpR family response regulator
VHRRTQLVGHRASGNGLLGGTAAVGGLVTGLLRPHPGRAMTFPTPSAPPIGTSERLSFADLHLDESSHEVRKGGERVALSPTEFKLLRYLMLIAGKVLSRRQILEHVLSLDHTGDAGVVESYVSYLRRKMDSAEPRLLHTVRGVGYMLRPPR